MISIIVPIYNCEKYLEKCIKSLINQTYKDLEIILINDGSTDNSYEICKKYKKIDKRIKIINNNNKGVSYSRNQGIKIAKGDYITFVDADDYIETNTYQKVLSKFSNEIDFIRYNTKHIDNKNFDKLYELKDKIIDIKQNEKRLFQHFFTKKNNIPCFSVLLVIKKDIAKKIFFNEKLAILEDADFYLQLFNNSKTGLFLDLKKYNYYINYESAMHNEKYYERNIFSIIEANKSIMKQLIQLDDAKLKKKINSTHLDKILNFLSELYYTNKLKFFKTFEKLTSNETFKKISDNTNDLKVKNRILLKLLKNKNQKHINTYLKIIKLLKKFK